MNFFSQTFLRVGSCSPPFPDIDQPQTPLTQ